jgi:DNA-directed RNA polymerase subunit RPC12/RpoP
VAKETSPPTPDIRYVCCDCNRMVFRKKGGGRKTPENRCDDCGHRMAAVRPILLAFGFGIGWACVLILASRSYRESLQNGKRRSWASDWRFAEG